MTTLILQRFRPEPALILRRFGPDGRLSALAERAAETPVPVVIGPPGADGTSLVAELLAAINLARGQAVAINRTTGALILGDPAYKPAAFVIGLVDAATLAGFVAPIRAGAFALADWSAIAGAAQLSPGQLYFLQPGGTIGTAPLVAPACQTVIGIAASLTTLIVDPQPPTQL